MRTFPLKAPIIAGAGALAFFMALAPEPGRAQDSPALAGTVLSEPAPSFAELRAQLDDSDRITALKALHIALMELGDGSALVWRKTSREMQGVIKPMSVFRDDRGRICRHLSYTLTLSHYRRRIEGIACREPDGLWSLSG